VSRAGAGCGTRRRPVAAALSGSTGTEQALVELTTLLRLELPVLRFGGLALIANAISGRGRSAMLTGLRRPLVEWTVAAAGGCHIPERHPVLVARYWSRDRALRRAGVVEWLTWRWRPNCARHWRLHRIDHRRQPATTAMLWTTDV
jgi:hypothetical protein